MIENKNICRGCLSNENTKILVLDGEIKDLFTKCTYLEVDNNDNLPQKICLSCIEFCQKWKSFQEKCIKSHQILLEEIYKKIESTSNSNEPNVLLKEETKEENVIVQDSTDTECFETDVNCDIEIKEESIETVIIHKVTINDEKTEKKHVRKSRRKFTKNKKKTLDKNKSLNNPSKIDCKSTADSTQISSPNDNLACIECHRYFQNETRYKKHMENHSSNIFECPEENCNYTAKKKYILKNHLETHSTEKSHQCNICKKYYKTAGTLRSHQKFHNANNKFFCDICGQIFNTRSHLLYAHSAKPCVCELCGKELPNKLALNNHKFNTHPKETKSVQCKYCDKRYPHKSLLDRHTQAVHEGLKHTCNVCSKEFSRKADLVFHVKHYHMNIPKPRNFKCDFCSVYFRNGTQLQYHRYIHTGEKPYQCKLCPAGFRQPFALKTHQKVHQKEIKT